VLGNPNYTSNKVWSPTLTADELSIYFGVEVSSTPEQIGVCTRSGISSEFGLGQIVQAGEAGQASYGTPFILPDGLTLYYYSIRTNGSSDRDLYVSRRNSVSAAFGSSQALTELNTTGPEHLPWVSNDELTIYFTRVASGQSDANIWRATRALASGPFDPPELVSELNSPATEDRVALTVDQRTIIFASQRVGGRMQLYQAVRATTSDPFGSPVAIPELASSASDSNPALTPDGNTLYFSSTRNGTNNQILRSTRTCP
jgi:Tol biopolymer transport system component